MKTPTDENNPEAAHRDPEKINRETAAFSEICEILARFDEADRKRIFKACEILMG